MSSTEVAFWGGPEDGAKKRFAEVPPREFDAIGSVFDRTDDQGQITHYSRHMYRYSLVHHKVARYRMVLEYRFSYHWIDEEIATPPGGGGTHGSEEVRDGTDSP